MGKSHNEVYIGIILCESSMNGRFVIAMSDCKRVTN